MIRLRFCLLLASAITLPLIAAPPAQAGGNPYCPKCGGGSDSPQAQYQQYQSQNSQSDSGSGKIFLSPGSSSSDGKAQPFYLKGLLENPTSGKYGMHYSVSTAPQPFPMNGGGEDQKKYPTVADLQAMAQKTQEANLKSALAESAERTRQIKEMQEAWAKQTQNGKIQAQNAAASGNGDSQTPNIKYIYRKSDPTKISAPPRVFLDNR